MDGNDTRSLRSKASVQSFMSLLQLDPQPMGEASLYNYEKDLPPLPEESPVSFPGAFRSHKSSSSSSSLGLSGSSSRGPIYYCAFLLSSSHTI